VSFRSTFPPLSSHICDRHHLGGAHCHLCGGWLVRCFSSVGMGICPSEAAKEIIRIKDYEGSLCRASMRGHLHVVKFLVKKGADLSKIFTVNIERWKEKKMCAAMCAKETLDSLKRSSKQAGVSDSYINRLKPEIANFEKVYNYLFNKTTVYYPELFI